MIYAESSIADSHLIQSNLQTSLDKLTVFNADHRIILSCTKSVRVLFERRKSKKLKPQDVSYNGQVIPASTSVKFLGITIVIRIIWLGNYWTMLLIRLCTFNASLNTFKSIVIYCNKAFRKMKVILIFSYGIRQQNSRLKQYKWLLGYSGVLRHSETFSKENFASLYL